MDRKDVSDQELVEIINDELKKHEKCEECRVNGIMSLTEPDPEGCNWSEPYVTCSGTPAEICQPIAAQVISKLRAEYNLK